MTAALEAFLTDHSGALSAGAWAERLRAGRDYLVANGASEMLLDANIAALRSTGEDWTEFVSVYGRALDDDVLLFVAPLRVPEASTPALGHALLVRDRPATASVAAMRPHLERAIGEALFGQALDASGRHVEFFHVRNASWRDNKDIDQPIAFFTPFNFGQYRVTSEMAAIRRTQMLTNVTLARHADFVQNAARRLGVQINGASPQTLALDCEGLNSAIAAWLFLHEIIHLNGPAPLFGGRVRKLELGLSYASIEEFRVDASLCVGLLAAQQQLGPLARQIVEIVVMERLLRSGADDHAYPLTVVEKRHGRLWRALMARHDAIRFAPEGVHIDLARVEQALVNVLTDIYQTEQAAAHMDDLDAAKLHLRNFAKQLTQRQTAP